MSESMQAVVVSGAERDKSQASVRLKLYNEDGSPYSGGGGGGVQVYTVKDLPLRDLAAADDLVLEIPVETGDILEIVTAIEVRANGDPVGESPLMHVVESAPARLLTQTGTPSPYDGGINLNVQDGVWFQICEDVRPPDLNPLAFHIMSTGLFTMTFSLDIALTPVQVDYRNWRVIARHYAGGG
jgi:hypothetical protein